MPILYTSLFPILLLTVLIFFYVRKNNRAKKAILPNQLLLVNELLEELTVTKIELAACVGSDQEVAHSFTLFEIALFVNKDYRFSNEMYDDYGIFFTANDKQIIDFDKYVSNKFLPDDIKEELNGFYNKKFKEPIRPSGSFFKLDLTTQRDAPKKTMRDFFEGSGEAFENWLTFKESADNLKFMIHQWITKQTDN